jgi:septum site-determining protein MinD
LARTIGIVSVKGGVGKTTSAANLGSALAFFGKKVLLVDADFTSPNLGLHFGIVKPKKSLHQVFQNKITAHEAVQTCAGNLDLLPCSLIAKKVNPYLLREKIAGLKKLYDVIIIDAAPTLNDDMLATIIASDELLVITSPDYPTMSATLHAVQIAKKQKTAIAGLVLNRVHGKKFELSEKEIEDAAGVPILGVVREDVRVPESIAETVPAAVHRPRAKSSRAYKMLAAKLVGVPYAEGFLGRIKARFGR